MDAALEVMLALRQVADLERAALQDARLGHVHATKTLGALRHRVFPVVEWRDEAAAGFFHFGEGVRLAALVANDKSAAS